MKATTRVPGTARSGSEPMGVMSLWRQPARTAVQAYAPPAVDAVVQLAGRPLEQHVRAAMEARLGHDFGAVRVHNDSASARSAEAISAQAYTVGRHVIFGESRYAPDTADGGALLAHELAHVVQQDAAVPRGPLRILSADNPTERSADASAAGRAVPQPGTAPGAVLQRRAVDDAFHLPCRGARPGAFATVQAAETEAIRILRRASAIITAHTILHPVSAAVGESPGLHHLRDALWRRFHFDYNRPGIRTLMLPLLARRYTLVADWIGRLRHRYDCAAAGVEPPGECRNQPGAGIAWTASGVNDTDLCERFWNDTPTERALTVAHEWFHFGFDWLGDCEMRNRNNTICYEMFAAELVGVATPADYDTCCVPPADPLPAFAP